MDQVKEKPKEGTNVSKMTTTASRLLVEIYEPEVPGLNRKIHYLHDHNYRVNFVDPVTGEMMKSSYVIIHPDKSVTIHDD